MMEEKIYTQDPMDFQNPPQDEDPKQRIVSADLEDLRYAGFWPRFAAYLIDLLVAGAVAKIMTYPLAADMTGYDLIYKLGQVLYFFTITWLAKGQTLGKMILGIRLETLDGPLTMGQIFIREVIMRYIHLKIPFLYVLTALLPKKQNLGDLVADTVVVNEKVEQILNRGEGLL